MFPASEPVLQDLTLAERAELERAVDGPITPAMIADKLRARSCPGARDESPHRLRTLIAWARADLTFYRRQIAALDAEIVTLMADRDGLYSDAEKDRKTRHIAALARQRDGLLEHCGAYETILQDAAGKLARTDDGNLRTGGAGN